MADGKTTISQELHNILWIIQHESIMHIQRQFFQMVEIVAADTRYPDVYRPISCGSVAEGMQPLFTILGSKWDYDLIMIASQCHAYEEISKGGKQHPDPQSIQFLVHKSESNPGYAMLQLETTDYNYSPYYCEIMKYCSKENDDKYYLSNRVKEMLNPDGETTSSNQMSDLPYKRYETQGPSIEEIMIGLNTEIFGSGFDKVDSVLAMPCLEWPSVAEEWITRDRKHGWPTEDIISQVKKAGACLVPLGCASSPTESLEWKYSFSHSEKYLTGSFNTIQFYCYCILKLLQNLVLKPMLGDIISSYIIKTSMFWAVEETPAKLWTLPMLLDFTRRCLMRIRDWVTKDFCPNYIMTDLNLLRNRYTPEEKTLVLDTLTDCIDNVEERVLPVLEKRDKFLSMWKQKIDMLIPKTEDFSIEKIFSYDNMSLLMHFFLFNDHLFPSDYESCTHSNNNINQTLSEMQTRYQHSTSEINETDPFHISLSAAFKGKMTLLSTMLQLSESDSKTDRDDPLVLARNLCQPIKEKTFLANKLYAATIYLLMGDMSAALDLLHKIELYYCNHPYFRIHLDHQVKKDNVSGFTELLVSTYTSGQLHGDDTMIVGDVHFAYLELPFLSTPIQLELACLEGRDDHDDEEMGKHDEPISIFQMYGIQNKDMDIISIDPLVYTHFLQFWCQRKLQNYEEQLMAVKNLKTRCEDGMTVHKDVAWNLLGFCHQTLGQNEDAFMAYCQALIHKRRSKATMMFLTLLVYSILTGERYKYGNRLNTWKDSVLAGYNLVKKIAWSVIGICMTIREVT